MKKAILFFGVLCLSVILIDVYIYRLPPKMPVNILIAPNLPQDAFAVTPKNLPLDKPLLSSAEQDKFKKIFLQRFFYPWSDNEAPLQYCITADSANCRSVKEYETNISTDFLNKPGFNSNYHPNSDKWAEAIVVDMQLNTFPNISCTNGSDKCRGIAIKNTNIRMVPTNDPSYDEITKPGEAYPFDYIQQSNLWLGTPVSILQQSKNQQWLLIKGPGLIGWVPSNSIAYASPNFIKQWQSHAFVTPILRTFSINASAQLPSIEKVYLGSILPFTSHGTNNYSTLFPVMTANHQAASVESSLSKNLVSAWPLVATPRNFNNLINQLLGMTYGWGGVGFNTDCSGTIQRLFGAFGIWLPRNSKSQLDFGGYIYPLLLNKYNIKEREEILKNNQVSLKPYLTLIGFGDEKNDITHVTLYLGKYPQQNPKHIVIFQSVWGAKIMQGHLPVGRAIIGKAAITTMDFGANLDLANSGYSTNTFWQIPGIYVTDLTQPINTLWLSQQNPTK